MDEQTQPTPRIDKLAGALAKAQAQFPAVPKTGKNPFLKNEYATLDDIIGAVRGPLGAHGLSFVQLLGSNGTMTLRTILLHESGQSLESVVDVAPTAGKGINELQALGSAITYMKRYTLGAMLGVATDGDTDGAGAPKQQARKKAAPKKQQAATRKTKLADALGDVDIISSPKELLKAVAHLDYFDQERGTPHMLNAIKKQTGYDKKSWPTNDPAWYANAYDALVEHVNANKALDAENAKAVISDAARQASF